jgi:hypothetical protein
MENQIVNMKPSNKALTGAESPASFAALYTSKNPWVSALGKPWIKLNFGRPAIQF